MQPRDLHDYLSRDTHFQISIGKELKAQFSFFALTLNDFAACTFGKGERADMMLDQFIAHMNVALDKFSLLFFGWRNRAI